MVLGVELDDSFQEGLRIAEALFDAAAVFGLVVVEVGIFYEVLGLDEEAEEAAEVLGLLVDEGGVFLEVGRFEDSACGLVYFSEGLVAFGDDAISGGF